MSEARFILEAALAGSGRRRRRRRGSTQTVNMANILLAEDDDAMRQFLATALSRAGHRVASHRDGREALAALDRRYDLLIADIVMPGLDGIELARRARAAQPGLRVMFITGFAAVALDEGKPVVEGATVLSKPFHLRDLVSQVKDLLAAA